MKFVVTGHAGHGKDTVCDLLHIIYDILFGSSSRIALEKAVWSELCWKYHYLNPEECFKDRDNHRQEWYEAVQRYNTPDKARLCKEIFARYDIYCGLRNIEEYKAYQKYNPDVRLIWVDASKRLPAEPDTSCTIEMAHANYVINNNGNKVQLVRNVVNMAQWYQL